MTPPDWFAGRRFGLAVAAVVVAATGLRAAGLGAWPFGSDELGTFDDVRVFYDPPVPVTHPDQKVPQVIPLSMTLLDFGHRLFGRDERGSRVLVAVLGVAHVALVAVGLRGLVGPAVALTAGAWLAVSVEHVFYSQYHRFYTLSALLVGAATLAAARAARTGSGGWAAVGCGFVGLGVLAHTLAGAAFGVVAVGAAVSAAAGRWRPAVVTGVGIAVAAAAFVAILLPLAGEKTAMPNFGGLSSRHAVLAAVAQVSWPACLLAAPGAVLLWRRDATQAAFWVGSAAVWLGAAVVLPGVLPYHSAYSFPLAVPVFVLAAVTAAELAAAVRARAGLLAAALVWAGLALLNLPALASYYQDGNRHDFRTAAEYVAAHVGPDDALLCNEPLKLIHYRPDLAPHVLPQKPDGRPAVPEVRLPPGGRLWVVVSGGRAGFEPGWRDWVHRHCHLQLKVARPRFDYYEFAVWVFRTPGPPPPPDAR